MPPSSECYFSKEINLIANQVFDRITREFRDEWLREGFGTTPFSIIQRLNHYVTAWAMSEQSHPSIDWVVPRKTVVAFGHTIHINRLPTMYQSIF